MQHGGVKHRPGNFNYEAQVLSHSHRYEDGGHHGGGFHHVHMDHHRQGGYDGRGAGGHREEIY